MIWALILAMMGMLMPKLADRCEQGEMIPLLKRHEIQVLLKAGFSVADVAERTSTSADTVRRVRKEAPVEHTDNAVERKQRGVGRPSKAAASNPGGRVACRRAGPSDARVTPSR